MDRLAFSSKTVTSKPTNDDHSSSATARESTRKGTKSGRESSHKRSNSKSSNQSTVHSPLGSPRRKSKKHKPKTKDISFDSDLTSPETDLKNPESQPLSLTELLADEKTINANFLLETLNKFTIEITQLKNQLSKSETLLSQVVVENKTLKSKVEVLEKVILLTEKLTGGTTASTLVNSPLKNSTKISSLPTSFDEELERLSDPSGSPNTKRKKQNSTLGLSGLANIKRESKKSSSQIISHNGKFAPYEQPKSPKLPKVTFDERLHANPGLQGTATYPLPTTKKRFLKKSGIVAQKKVVGTSTSAESNLNGMLLSGSSEESLDNHTHETEDPGVEIAFSESQAMLVVKDVKKKKESKHNSNELRNNKSPPSTTSSNSSSPEKERVIKPDPFSAEIIFAGNIDSVKKKNTRECPRIRFSDDLTHTVGVGKEITVDMENIIIGKTKEKREFKGVLYNFRDLALAGKAHTSDSHPDLLKFGSIYRSACVCRGDVTPSDVKFTLNYLKDKVGIKTIIDFRSKDEKMEDPYEGLVETVFPTIQVTESELYIRDMRTKRFYVPLLNSTLKVKGLFLPCPTSTKLKMLRNVFNQGQVQHTFCTDVMSPIGLSGLNKLMLTYAPQEIATVLRICADVRHHPIMYHCSSGKDRTGLISALILAVCDINKHVIVDNYQQSEMYLGPVVGLISEENKAKGLDSSFDGTPRKVMEETLGFMKSKSGSVKEFLHKEIGFTYEEQEQLKQALVTHS